MKQLFAILAFLLPVCSFGQVNESFNTPEITDVYPWQGELSKFTINSNHQLQLSAFGGGTACIYLQGVPLTNNEWSFHVSSENTVTTQNQFYIYLWSLSNNTDYPGNAFLVRIGGSKKNIALCRQIDGKTPEVLFDGRTIPSNQGTFVDVKVTSDDSGNIILYSKFKGEPEYYKEGEVQVETSNMNGYFMLYTVYTVNYNKDKYFDDIYIARYLPTEDVDEGEEEEIKTPVTLTKIKEISANCLELYFDRTIAIDNSSFDFYISDIGEEIDVSYSPENLQVLRIEWKAPLTKNQLYTLLWSGIYDSDGNECRGNMDFTSTAGMEKEESDGNSTKTDSYPAGSIIINEVMADPVGLTELPETEYVELYNASNNSIDLGDWSFIYADRETKLTELLLPADGYAVLYKSGRTITLDKGGFGMPLQTFPAQLANTGKYVALKDPTGTVIDQSDYPKSQKAVAWERNGNDWKLSTDSRGGTPGAKNSSVESEIENPDQKTEVVPESIIINEILPNPFEGGSEYIELFNRTSAPVPVNGLSIATRKLDGTFNKLYSLAEIKISLAPKAYIVLTKDKVGVTDYYYTSSAVDNIHEVMLPVLANTTSTIVLLQTKDSIVIDEVSYSNKWHASSIKEEKGVALERIDPDQSANDPKNWTSASFDANYGTPGYKNSQYLNHNDSGITGINTPEYSEETNEYYIAYHLDKPGYNCRAFVYNLSGMRIAEIANNELMGTSGRIIWNGITSNGGRLQSGIYIIYIELYHPSGEVKRFKKPFITNE